MPGGHTRAQSGHEAGEEGLTPGLNLNKELCDDVMSCVAYWKSNVKLISGMITYN